jgi:hypothetical protein
MPKMEPNTSLITMAAEAATEVAKKDGESFLACVLGEPLKEFGGLLKDRIAARRHRNLTKIAVAAKKQLEEHGLEPQEVPLKIIHPLLEASSLEEDNTLQGAWTNLLSDAASGKELPYLFLINAVRELSKKQALFFKVLYTKLSMADKELPDGEAKRQGYRPFEDIKAHASLSDCYKEANGEETDMDVTLALETFERLRLVEWILWSDGGAWRVTSFGRVLAKRVLGTCEE